MSEVSHVQWFPGHMAKTRRIMASNLKLVDAVVEITDARIPFSSRNPEMKRIVGSKPRLVLLNKADSADPEVTAMWLDYYAKQGITALATDCRSGKNVSKFYGKLKELLKDDIEKWNAKGMSGRPIRIMIVGIPNVGKSSFINRLAGSRLAKVEDRPGVTRGKQWVKLDEGFELLDMPGVLWPKFEDKLVGERLRVDYETDESPNPRLGLTQFGELCDPQVGCEVKGIDRIVPKPPRGLDLLESVRAYWHVVRFQPCSQAVLRPLRLSKPPVVRVVDALECVTLRIPVVLHNAGRPPS